MGSQNKNYINGPRHIKKMITVAIYSINLKVVQPYLVVFDFLLTSYYQQKQKRILTKY